MITISSPEKRHLADPQRITKSRKISLDFNQNSTKNESHHAKTQVQHLEEHPEHLKIDNIGIPSLPSRVCILQSLKHLDASGNKLQDLPDDLGRLENLEILDLSFNNLSKFPISCAALNRLKQLVLSNNRFKSIPECVEEGMQNLEILDVSHNPLKFISAPASTKLKRFSANGLKYCRFFPEWLLNSKFWKLDEINLDDSVFDKFRFREKQISHLRRFSMRNSSLNDKNLEQITSNMVELQKINVDNDKVQLRREGRSNIFCTLPGSNLRNPGVVQEINARMTALSILPHSIDKFFNLKRLDIGENQLCWLPDEICVLQNLQVLIIDSCELGKLPEKIGNLDKLEEISACNNRLMELPRSMANLKNLKILDLFNNELSEIPTCLEGEKLKYLDLEKNFFAIKNSLMRNTPYDILRERLRQHYNYERDVGSKTYREDKTFNYNDAKASNSCSGSECGEM
ncbi:plant intracellular Ras-group-related LRR protein 4-like isoform X2 [Belonocnema kinseyi]|uniref:plant intracellular Ras-group-related LRR protein 4-like isoform X2 n=1 Tax=Belonocnema kinseyi TaxID=2817044 RepID=UPI00143DFDD5|nr:plant intracellular Ras-group-related LRR protein 4-like isoform X2 [Belonocnema kinseyi]